MGDETYAQRVADRMREHSVYALAELADCGTPDTGESAGAVFLTGVRDATADAVASVADAGDLLRWLAGDGPHEIADGAPGVWTVDRWAEFVDLAAYHEDVTELGPVSGDDLTRSVAGVALYMIADRLVGALVEDATENVGEDMTED